MQYQLLVVLIYLVITALLGWYGFKKTRSATDYLVAGRNTHPFVMALSYGATFISTSAIVGFGGAAAVFGLGLLWLTFLNIFVGILVAFVVFGARTRRMGHHLSAHTFPELLGKRFNSKFMQISAGLIIFVFMPLYAAVVLMGGARFLETQFSMSYLNALLIFTIVVALYVIMGGLKGVMYTDAFQGVIMFVGMSVLLVFTYVKLGGFTAAHQALAALPVPEKLAAAGHQGWASMPAWGSPYWWILVSTIVMGVGIGVLAQPQLVVRFMTVKSKCELNRAVGVGGVFILFMTGVAFVVGALSNVYFMQNPAFGKIAIAVTQGDVEKVIPVFIKNAMPEWFGVLFMVTLLSAAMSTLSSQFHAMGTAIGRDVFEQLLPKRRDGQTVSSTLITKLGICLTIVISLFLAWWLPIKFEAQGVAIIARGTAIFFGLCAAAFLPAYIGALYVRGTTKAGAVIGMIAGFLTSGFWLLFCHAKESEALLVCQRLFQKPCLLQMFNEETQKWVSLKSGAVIWAEVDPIFIALPIAAVITILVSIVTTKFKQEFLDHCFAEIKK